MELKKVSFVNDKSPMGYFLFWSYFEILGGFGHSKRELVVEILFFLFTGAPREKTRGGAETVWSFIFTGERAKKPKRLKCI